MQSKRPPKDKMIALLKRDGVTVFALAAEYEVSTQTIRNWMKKYSLASPTGFFSRGKKIGRPKGIKMSEEQKQLRSRMFSGKGNPFYGRKHTAEARKRMSEDRADITGDNNPFKRSLEDPEKRAAHRKRCKETWAKRDAAWRKRFGETVSKAQAGRDQAPYHKHHEAGIWACAKTYSGWTYYRSSWEREMIELMDRCPFVSSIEYESLTIPYRDEDGMRRWTRSDFVVTFTSGERLLLEVKPKALADQQEAKLDGQEEYCILHDLQYAVFTGREVKDKERATRLLSMAHDGLLHPEQIVGPKCPSMIQYIEGLA